jgi:hypothetical protein
MEPKHSGWGIASFIISIAAGILIFITIVIAGVIGMDTPDALDENETVIGLIGLAILGLMLVDLLAFIFGIVGLLQRDTKKVFAILGIIFSGIILLGTLGLMVLGIAAG